MKNIIFILYIILLAPVKLISQNMVLTYEDAVNIVVLHNIDIKEQKNQLKVNQAERLQGKANFLPNLNASGAGYRTTGLQWSDEESALLNTTIDRANYSIGTEMPVFNGLKNIHSLKQTNLLYSAQKELVEQTIQDVVLLTSQQFLQILLDEELIAIADENFEVQKNLYYQLSAQVNLGAKSQTELFLQEAQLKTSEVDLLTEQNKLRSDKTNLSKTLQLEPDKEFVIVGPNWSIDSVLNMQLKIDSLMLLAKENRPDIKRLNAEENASLQSIRISRSGYFPSIGIFYNYGSYYASNNTRLNADDNLYYDIGIRDQMFENYSHKFGVNISIPIFNRMQVRTEVVSSKVAHENAKLACQDFEMQLFLDVQDAYNDFISYKKSYLANVASANASQRSYQHQEEMYKMGQGSLIDLSLENQRNIEAKSKEIQARYTLVFQLIVIDYQLGLVGM